MALNFADVQRGGQVVHHGVEKRLHALVAVCGATQHRVHLRVDGELADGTLDLINGEFLATEVPFHQFFVGFSNSVEQLFAVLFSAFHQVSGDLFDGGLSTNLDLSTPGDGLHFHQVNNAVEVVFSTDRQLQNQRLCAEAVDDGLNGEVEVSAQLVHLVHEADTRDVVLSSLTPNLLGLGLHAFFAVEHCNSTVQDTQGTLHLNGEVHVTGGVDDVDLVTLPETGHSSGGNGDAALFLLLHPVGG